MNKIRRIIVTGDIFRVSQKGDQLGNQNVNIEWLYQLIRPCLEMLTGLSVVPLYCASGENCMATQIYNAKGFDVTFVSWVSLYESEPSPRMLAIMDDQFHEAFLVGFEMPEFVRRALDVLNIPYVDFTIHPVRFMDDLIFGIRSNLSGLAEALRDWVVSEDEIHLNVGFARATLARLPSVSKCNGVQGAALFCGQTTDDKVLIRNGRLMRADDFLPQFAEMCDQHERVFIKPHPFSPDNPVVLTLTRLFPNTEVVDANFYHLLVHDGITHIYSITSSTSIEAAYFGKDGRHLSRYPYVFTEFSASGGAYLTINSEIYSPKFWMQIIKLLKINHSQSRCVDIVKVPSRMRRSLRSFWGADVFERI